MKKPSLSHKTELIEIIQPLNCGFWVTKLTAPKGINQMKNKLVDLNNHLFAQLERLNDENLSNEELAKEMDRTSALASVSKEIINNASLALQAEKFKTEFGRNFKDAPAMLQSN